MLDFIAKYWLEFVFGIVTLIMSGVAKHFWTMYKKGKEAETQQQDDAQFQKTVEAINALREELKQDIQDRKEENKREDDEIAIIRQGVLALWRKTFLETGRTLLADGHNILYEEYMTYMQDHVIYNNLGGNHEGDEQFKLVTAKYQRQADFAGK